MNIGIKGISYSTTERKYLVRAKKDSKRVYVGRFSSLEEAKEALASHEDVPARELSNTPILESLRATFAPKKTKTTSYKAKSSKSKGKSSDAVKTIKEPAKQLSKPVKVKVANKSATQRIKKSDAVGLSEPSQEAAEATIQIDYHRVGEISLHRILSYLIKEADKRGTSVFDVIVQEVARRSK